MSEWEDQVISQDMGGSGNTSGPDYESSSDSELLVLPKSEVERAIDRAYDAGWEAGTPDLNDEGWRNAPRPEHPTISIRQGLLAAAKPVVDAGVCEVMEREGVRFVYAEPENAPLGRHHVLLIAADAAEEGE